MKTEAADVFSSIGICCLFNASLFANPSPVGTFYQLLVRCGLLCQDDASFPLTQLHGKLPFSYEVELSVKSKSHVSQLWVDSHTPKTPSPWEEGTPEVTHPQTSWECDHGLHRAEFFPRMTLELTSGGNSPLLQVQVHVPFCGIQWPRVQPGLDYGASYQPKTTQCEQSESHFLIYLHSAEAGTIGGQSSSQYLDGSSSVYVLRQPTLCDPMDCSQPDSSVYGSLQAKTLEWAAIPFSRGSS